MDAAVSLHHHHGNGVLPLPAAVPPPHHNHCRTTLPIPALPSVVVSSSSSSSKPPPARLNNLPAACSTTTHAAARYSTRAATGYAAALADACVRAGTLHRASRHARALLLRRSSRLEEEANKLDARVAALVRMLVAKGKAGMVAEVMAEFAAICDHLMLPRRPASSRLLSATN